MLVIPPPSPGNVPFFKLYLKPKNSIVQVHGVVGKAVELCQNKNQNRPQLTPESVLKNAFYLLRKMSKF